MFLLGKSSATNIMTPSGLGSAGCRAASQTLRTGTGEGTRWAAIQPPDQGVNRLLARIQTKASLRLEHKQPQFSAAIAPVDSYPTF